MRTEIPSTQATAEPTFADLPRWVRAAATALTITVAVLLASSLAVVMGLS